MHTDRHTDTESRIIQTLGLVSSTCFFSLLVFVFELCGRTPRIPLYYSSCSQHLAIKHRTQCVRKEERREVNKEINPFMFIPQCLLLIGY